MGCKSSRIERSTLVSLCRERRKLIAAAVERRYALAAAHAAYFDALASVGDALQRFVQEELTVVSSLPPGSPVLTIPSPDEKGNTKTFGRRSAALAAASSVSSSATPLSHAFSIDDSHLPLSSIGCSEVYQDGLNKPGGSGGHGAGELSSPPNQHTSYSSFNSSFLKSSIEVPRTVYQDPFAPPWSNSLYNGYGFDYPRYGVPMGLATPGRDEKLGPSAPPVAPATPPPPSPVKTSGWEFFDPFNTYEHFVNHFSQGKLRTGSFMSSPDLIEVRKQEGIPDLEWDAEPKKEAEKEKKEGKTENVVKNDIRGKGSGNLKKLEPSPAKDSERRDEKNHPFGLGKEGRKDRASSKGKSGGEDEASNWKRGLETFDKNSCVTEGSAPPGGKSPSSASSGKSFFLHATRDAVDAVKEIKEHFHSAADCGEEVSRMLEVDKFPYNSRSRRFGDILSRIWDPIAMPVLTSSHSFRQPQPINLSTLDETLGKDNLDNDIIQKSGSLSTTLEKLYLWEDRLYKEVKGEERLRIIYDRKYKEIKSLVCRGVETSKIEMTRTSLRKLQTKISIIIRSVNSISNKMHMIRDEELMPQLTELIQGLIRMWKTVLSCHQKQLKAIISSKIHKLVVKTGSQSETVAETTKELELELLNWYQCFNNLIDIQKSYIEALNGWLISWLPQEDEVTPDGVAPFSPSQIGAPAVFVLSNDWCHANKTVSGKQVAEALHAFIAVLQFLSEAQKEEQRRRLEAEYFSGTYAKVLESLLQKGKSGNLDIESSTKDGLEHNDNSGMMKLELLRKRLDEKLIKHEETLKRIKSVTSSTLQSRLAPLFEELENFTLEILRAYDSLRIPNLGIVTHRMRSYVR